MRCPRKPNSLQVILTAALLEIVELEFAKGIRRRPPDLAAVLFQYDLGTFSALFDAIQFAPQQNHPQNI